MTEDGENQTLFAGRGRVENVDGVKLPDEFPAQVPSVHASVPLVTGTRHQVVITFLLLADK